MSLEVIREAAAHMRIDYDGDSPRIEYDDRWLAIAAWLDWVADGWSWNPSPIGNERHAVTVARAYLGEIDA